MSFWNCDFVILKIEMEEWELWWVWLWIKLVNAIWVLKCILMLRLFRCKIFSNVKYFTPKIFYRKYFPFIVFGFVLENSFASVKWKKENHQLETTKLKILIILSWNYQLLIRNTTMNQTTQTHISYKKKKKIQICNPKKKKKKNQICKKPKNIDLQYTALRKTQIYMTQVEIYRTFVWQGLAVKICTKHT